MDCDGCVKNAVSHLKGVKSVEVKRKQSRVVVNGNNVKSRGKRAELWAYIPQHVVYYPYAPGAYDKRAPNGFVRNVAQASSAAPEAHFVSFLMFMLALLCHLFS